MTSMNPLGSGLDVASIVSQLMDIEKRPLLRLDNSRQLIALQQKKYEGLKTQLQRFEAAVAKLSPAFNTVALRGTSSNEGVVSAAVTGNSLSSGTHTLSVTTLASAHQLASAAQSVKNSALGIAGDLTMTVGGNTLTLNVSNTDTLENIRDNINQTLNNPGISASILATTGTGGAPEYRLVLTSGETGAGSTITMGGSMATMLDVTHERVPAADAAFTFDGYTVVRSSNTVTDLLDGLTLHLNGTGGPATVSVLDDRSGRAASVKGAIHEMADAYNSVVELIDKNQANSLLRDNTWPLVKMRLRTALWSASGGNGFGSLLDAGLKSAEPELRIHDEATNANGDALQYAVSGKILVDDARLDLLMQSAAPEFVALFSGKTNGLAGTVAGALEDIRKPGGIVSNREKGMQDQDRLVQERITREESRLEDVQNALTKQYSALNSFILRYQGVSDFLEKQLSTMNIYNKGR